jgi:hypothetical protein
MEVGKEEWGANPDLLDYVKSSHKGWRVIAVEDDNPHRIAFKERAEQWFDELGVVRRSVVTFLSIQPPERGDGYAEAYPHSHNDVIIYYLDPSDVPTPLHIFDEGKVVDEVVPYAGLSVYVPKQVLHGVPKHKGERDRIQIIAMAK